MENFIANNISIINKNNILVIRIGNNLNGNFINKISEKKIQEFIKKLYQKYPHIKKFRVDTNKKIYKYKNTITEVNNKVYDNYSYQILESEIINDKSLDFHLSVIKKNFQDECFPSLYNYHYIEELEEYIVDINNLFNIIISNTKYKKDTWYSIRIEIKKPNNSKKLYNKIESIINMI